MDNPAPHFIFWTAGFDSTFRLAQLLLESERHVQPIYVIDFERDSTFLEMKRMVLLRRKLRKLARRPEGFLPTRVYLKDEFEIESDIRLAFSELRSRTHIGSQYEWLAQVARSIGLGDGNLEMCMTRHDPPSGLQRAIFDDLDGEKPRLESGSAETVFRYFSFPTLHLSKSDMDANARKMNIEHILGSTWFCHHPLGMLPCGTCNPCRIAKRERGGIAYARFGKVRVLMSRALRLLGKR